MTKKELRDKAYIIATGNSMTKSFNYEEFQKCNTNKHKWEPFEHWDKKEIKKHITQIAENIITNFEELCND